MSESEQPADASIDELEIVDAVESVSKSRMIVGGGADAAAAYVPPTTLPKKTHSNTIDVEKVRLNPKIDPRAQEMKKLPAGNVEDPTARVVLKPEALAKLVAAAEPHQSAPKVVVNAPPVALADLASTVVMEPKPSPVESAFVAPANSTASPLESPPVFDEPEVAPPPKRSPLPIAIGGGVLLVVVLVAVFAMKGSGAKDAASAAPTNTAAAAVAPVTAAPPPATAEAPPAATQTAPEPSAAPSAPEPVAEAPTAAPAPTPDVAPLAAAPASARFVPKPRLPGPLKKPAAKEPGKYSPSSI